MAGRKQVMDMRSETGGVSQKESDEQQRNWTAQQWKKKAADSLANYDPTRAKLNFEVVRGGVVQPIDTSKSIAQKMAENLAARGIRDPNSNADGKRKYRTLAKFIFGGNRERMHELAFGTQKVDLTKGADNSGITRCQEIEDWARDVYNFMAKRYGEDNIISFYVHLDEKNPHIHCTMVPVDIARNRISWRTVFGSTIEAESANMTALHSELVEQVNKKWGLERGSNMEETKARHRSTEEYKRELVSEVCDLETTRQGLLRQIRRAEIKLKGISTMIANLRERKQIIQDEIDEIARQFGQDGCDHAALASRMAALRSELEDVKSKLSLRQQMLEDAERTILAARARLAALKQEHAEIREHLGADFNYKTTELQKNLLATYNDMVASSWEPVRPTLSEHQQHLLDESGFTHLTDNAAGVINCALLLSLNCIREATAYAESFGGSTVNNAGWGRDKDEDDEQWWRRCIARSAAMMRPGGKKRQRGR